MSASTATRAVAAVAQPPCLADLAEEARVSWNSLSRDCESIPFGSLLMLVYYSSRTCNGRHDQHPLHLRRSFVSPFFSFFGILCTCTRAGGIGGLSTLIGQNSPG